MSLPEKVKINLPPKLMSRAPWPSSGKEVGQKFGPAKKSCESSHFFFAYAHAGLFRVLEIMHQQGSRIVYLPAFICDVVALAIRQAGLVPRYYAVDSCFRILWPSLRKVASGEIFLSVNYFGLQIDTAEVRNFCRKKKLFWIHDNSHGFACRRGAIDLGNFGDISLTSFRKVLPARNGAVVQINHPHLRALLSHDLMADRDLRAEPGRWKFATKQILRPILPWILRLPDFTQPCKPTAPSVMAYRADPRARRIFLRADRHRIRTQRRHNYRALQTLWLGGKYPFAKPAVSALPPGSSPLVFPLRIPDLQAWRAFLQTARRKRLDAHTWPTLPSKVLRQSTHGAKRLWASTVFLPVHQDLTSQELVGRVSKVADLVMTELGLRSLQKKGKRPARTGK